MKVLILCTGNSCRSQMAHGFLQSFDKSLEVHSAGTQPASQVNLRAVEVMNETGIDISLHTPKSVNIYLDEAWDYVITVCGGANETCPMFQGKVGKRMHIGFDDPSEVQESEEFVMNEFRRVRDEVRRRFAEFYITEILKKEMPKCSCGGKC
ncbi:MAG: arsenate reductase ArsC [Bacteroidaceae bacterium]|nr:arsenate reductase ArsC [Bacteroidaceae bacterium]